MSDGSDGRGEPDAAERALSAFELLGALVACALIASSPVWLALLVSTLDPTAGLLVGALSAAIVLAFPALLRTRRTRHLNGYERWGTNVALALRMPLDLTRKLGGAKRDRRALSAGETTAAVKALEPPRDSRDRE